MALSLFRARPALHLIALLLALSSNYFFTGEWFGRFQHVDVNLWTWRQSLASCLLVAAIGLALWAFNRSDDFVAEPAESQIVARTVAWWRLLPCASLYLASTVVYLVRGETPLVRWLWLCSLFALVIPLLGTFDRRDFWPIPLWEYLLLLLLVGLGFLLRYIYLTDLPFHTDNDVAIMGTVSREMILKNNHSWVGMSVSDHQFSEHQFLCLSMRLFGVNHYGLVLFSVLAGTATIAVVHFIGRVAFNRWVGLIAAALLVFNHVHIHFSRIVFGPITTFFLALGCLFFLHGWKRGSICSYALGGLATGGGLLGYYSGRVGIVVLGFALLIYLITQRHISLAFRWQSAAVALTGALAVFGPNLAYAIRNFSTYHGRGNAVILWTEGAWQHATYSYGGGFFVVMREQIKRTLLAPFYFPDSGGICHLTEPMLGSLAAVSLMLGLGYLLRRLGLLSGLYLLAWAAFTFLCGGILTIDPPFWPHLNVAVPALVLIAAVGAERFIDTLIRSRVPLAATVLPIALTAAVFASGVQNFIIYFDFATRHVSSRVLAMRQIQDLDDFYRVVLVSTNTLWEHASFRFFCPTTDGSDVSPASFLTQPPEVTKPTAFLLFTDAGPECAALLQKTYPFALREDVKDSWNTRAFTMVRVLPPGFTPPVRKTSLPDSSETFAGWPYLLGLALLLICPAVFIFRREGEVQLST